jgi:predicted metal-dependent HD superfamily phosphohydrolase
MLRHHLPMSARTPPPLDPTPYGRDLAERVAVFLKQGHALLHGHRDYCGMGLVFSHGRFCYGQVEDGWILPPDELTASPDSPHRVFARQEDFVEWLASQSDLSLARLEAEDSFYHRNQTLTRERLEEFAAVRESVPFASQPRWERLCKAIPAGEALSDRYFFMFAAYSEPHRHYHNLRHLNECLQEFDRVKDLAAQPVALETALWFHDVLYDPGITDNEERSAGYAREFLTEADVAAGFIDTVCRLVLLTKTHQPDDTPDAALICDIDLAILGKDRARFREYEAAIRAEYGHVPDDQFRAGRSEVLRRFLDRPHIYHSEHFRSRYEDRARQNLRQSIEELTPRRRRWRWFG